MGRRLDLLTEIAQNVVSAAGAAFVLAGLVPLLWRHDGWPGVAHKTGLLIPMAVGFAVFGPLGRRWRASRARRRAARRQAIAPGPGVSAH
jgi:hypothetical protein